jgi:hypothetical protein
MIYEQIDRRGSAAVVFLTIALLITLGLASYVFLHKASGPPQNVAPNHSVTATATDTTPVIQTNTSSTETGSASSSPEDGSHDAYIERIYAVSGTPFLDAAYFQTLSGKAAVLQAIDDGTCIPSRSMTKAEAIALVNSLDTDPSRFQDEFYNLRWDCFPNGIWLDTSPDVSIKSLPIALESQILVSSLRAQYGPHTLAMSKSAWTISLSTLTNIVRATSNIPFTIVVLNGKVIGIVEIYRP